MNAYSNAGAKFLYAAVAIFLTAFAFFMSSRKIWKDDVRVHRPGKCYLMEAALIGVFIVLCMQDTLVELIWQQNYRSFAEISNATHTKGTYEVLSPLFGCACFLFCVYAMPNSRVYVEVKTTENMVEIVMKNMSAEELNINAEEITERFVRGDSSRNTEGSGLGLAIAKSFTEAQGGKFHIEVDGDLFKAVLEFPLA